MTYEMDYTKLPVGETIEFFGTKKIISCPKCGKAGYMPSDMVVVHKQSVSRNGGRTATDTCASLEAYYYDS